MGDEKVWMLVVADQVSAESRFSQAGQAFQGSRATSQSEEAPERRVHPLQQPLDPLILRMQDVLQRVKLASLRVWGAKRASGTE